MARLVFDLESDGLLDVVSRLHCISILDLDSGDHRLYAPDQPEGVEVALERLSTADLLIGHNVISYDLMAIQRCHPGWRYSGTVRDTLVLCRLMYHDLAGRDAPLVKAKKLPSKLHGSHKLEAWGYRLGEYKGDYSGGWETYTPAMGEYCQQDVAVTAKLWKRLEAKLAREKWGERAVELEHETALLLAQVQVNGFPFDEAAAAALWADLVGQQDVINRQVQTKFPPIWVGGKPEESTRSAKFWRSHHCGGDMRPNKKTQRGEWGWYEHRHAGSAFTPVEMQEFNPGSRHHVAKRLMTLGWVPKAPDDYTESGQIKVAEKNLRPLPYPEAQVLVDYMRLGKVLGMLATGDNAWLKLSRGGVMRPSYLVTGTVSGRAAHFKPNIAQTPKVRKDREGNVVRGIKGGFGYECRSLFHAPPGYKLVGADMSGLEFRCLAHFLARYDNGAFGRLLLTGDIHTANQSAFGFHLRDSAKTGIYALLYGASALRLYATLVDDARKAGQPIPKGNPQVLGQALKDRFFTAVPALAKLLQKISLSVKKGRIVGLDGRLLFCRSEHSALNLILQSAGAVLCKAWIVLADRKLRERGYRHGVGQDFWMTAWIHDEIQLIAREDIAEEVGQVLVECCREVGQMFDFRCPLDGEFKIGQNWAETH